MGVDHPTVFGSRDLNDRRFQSREELGRKQKEGDEERDVRSPDILGKTGVLSRARVGPGPG